MTVAPTLYQENSSTMIALFNYDLQFTLINVLRLFLLLCLSVIAGEISLSSTYPYLPCLPLSAIHIRIMFTIKRDRISSPCSNSSHRMDRIKRKYHTTCSHAAHCWCYHGGWKQQGEYKKWWWWWLQQSRLYFQENLSIFCKVTMSLWYDQFACQSIVEQWSQLLKCCRWCKSIGDHVHVHEVGQCGECHCVKTNNNAVMRMMGNQLMW